MSFVNDMLIGGSNDDMIKVTKKVLTSTFDMKDMGIADVILGIKIAKTSRGLTLSQSHCVEKILDQFNKNSDGVAKITCECQSTPKQEYWRRSISVAVFSNNRQFNVFNELHEARHCVLN